ncbi:hypothetical protein LMF89_08505 [Pelosinus sp. Bkl1]|uniref:N-acetyltransferase domain-containing protein n=1 Tax=Pelosinus baikalensis TaxID=2892015 RepID=A0ABS8HQR5_9FIRM|nr:hypothetical protein [Pelosinus baikalensis]
MLKLALKYCKQLGLEKVMLVCYKDNEASRKTIINCGGILKKDFIYTDGQIVQKILGFPIKPLKKGYSYVC